RCRSFRPSERAVAPGRCAAAGDGCVVGRALCRPAATMEGMRILLFSGKGGVGKTSLAAATGVRLSQLGYRTLVMSIDPAHSLADSFDLETDLFHSQTSDPLPLDERLAILELNIQKEIKRHWQEI